MKCPILAYHNIDTRSEWGINTVSPALFEKQMSYLAGEGYKTCSLDDYVSGKAITDRSIIITFDDAYEGVVRHAFPVMGKYGMTGTVFVISDYVGAENRWDHNLGGRTFRHASWSGIRRLAESGWEIGSHTARHRDLSGLTCSELRNELDRSKHRIEDELSAEVKFLSYPFNRVNERVIRTTEEIGYSGGCCMTRRVRLERLYGNYLIPRRGVYAIDVLPIFRRKIRTDSFSKIFDLNQRIISACSVGTICYGRLVEMLKKSIAI
ncbi:polysaccharide deacetylase family protein [candidate division KSB1 bacterium]|nr:polysaccharide deacetylase family protein [candidate division KSB1 bacterium]